MRDGLDGYLWSDGDSNGGFGYTKDFQTSFFPGGASNETVLEAREQNIEETPKFSHDQNDDGDDIAKKIMRLKPLGLRLSMSQNFMNSLSSRNYIISHGEPSASSSDQGRCSSIDFSQQPISEKLKASNFPASRILIGSWQVDSRTESHVVAKCYFAKRKLVWEILKGGLKSKIEIQWSDIIGINAIMEEDQPGVLQIELNQPPTFHEENDPQPRKHTIWKPATDFTGGQASIYRRHYLVFPPGSLDRHYDKLLHSEPRLFELSKQGFPTLRNPLFRSKNEYRSLSLDYPRQQQQQKDVNSGLLYKFPSFPPAFSNIQPTQHYGLAGLSAFKDIPSPSSVMDFSPLDSCSLLNNQSTPPYWGHGIKNYTDALARSQAQDLVAPILSNQFDPAISSASYSLPSYSPEAEMSYAEIALNDIRNRLFDDRPTPNYDERYHMARVESLNQLVDLESSQNAEGKNASQEAFYGQDSIAEESLVFSTGEDTTVIGGQCYEQQLVPGMHQSHPVNPSMPQSWNMPYDLIDNPDPAVDDFEFSNRWS